MATITDAINQPSTPQLRKGRDQDVSAEAEAEVAVRAVCATKLPTLTHDDTSRCAGVCVLPLISATGSLFGTATLLPQERRQRGCPPPHNKLHVPPKHINQLWQPTPPAAHRFRGLLSDLFPGVPVTDATNPQLEAALKEAAAEEGLTLTPQQVRWLLTLTGSAYCAWRSGLYQLAVLKGVATEGLLARG